MVPLFELQLAIEGPTTVRFVFRHSQTITLNRSNPKRQLSRDAFSVGAQCLAYRYRTTISYKYVVAQKFAAWYHTCCCMYNHCFSNKWWCSLTKTHFPYRSLRKTCVVAASTASTYSTVFWQPRRIYLLCIPYLQYLFLQE